jgi:hypothetical protein
VRAADARRSRGRMAVRGRAARLAIVDPSLRRCSEPRTPARPIAAGGAPASRRERAHNGPAQTPGMDEQQKRHSAGPVTCAAYARRARARAPHRWELQHRRCRNEADPIASPPQPWLSHLAQSDRGLSRCAASCKERDGLVRRRATAARPTRQLGSLVSVTRHTNEVTGRPRRSDPRGLFGLLRACA